jgi:prefoldin subunit 5
MKKKSEALLKEKKEINNHIKDPNKEVTNVNIENLSKEDLEKRIIYLNKLHEAYEDIIITMENVDLPDDETKEFLINIVSNYYITYDLNDNYRVDISKFKQFAYKNEKKLIESFSQSRFLKTQ